MCGAVCDSHKIHHFSFGERVDGKTYPMDELETIPDGTSDPHNQYKRTGFSSQQHVSSSRMHPTIPSTLKSQEPLRGTRCHFYSTPLMVHPISQLAHPQLFLTNFLLFFCVPPSAAEGHYLYNLRVIPTVDKKLSRDPKYNYEFAFQESLHKVRRRTHRSQKEHTLSLRYDLAHHFPANGPSRPASPPLDR